MGERLVHLRKAVFKLSALVDLVRLSSVYETDPLDSPPGSAAFLNLVVVGHSSEAADTLLVQFRAIERSLGRRSSTRNAPRPIDIDIVCFGGELRRTRDLELPHPRFREREFVLAPLRELNVEWIDAAFGSNALQRKGRGEVRRAGSLY